MPTPLSLARAALRAQPNRIFGLDLLRALAILTTVYGHAALLLPAAYRSWHNAPASAIDGVNIFFVLSGYLIGGILLKALLNPEASFSLKHFWLRRWLRTLPAYLVVLAVVVVAGALQHRLPTQVLRYGWFGQNLAWPHPDFFPEAWSLAVEEWFYLLFPVGVLLGAALLRSRRRAFAGAIVLFLVLPPLFKLYQYGLGRGLNLAQWDTYYRRIVAARLDAITLGVLACYLRYYYPAAWQALRRPGLWLAAGLLSISFLYPKLGAQVLFYNVWLRAPLECLAVFLVLPFFSQLRPARTTALMRGLTLLSVISYSMYLLNETVLIKLLLLPLNAAVFTPWLGPAGWVVGYVLYWVLLLGISLLLYTYVEQPAMRFREVMAAGPAAVPAPAARLVVQQ